MNELAQFVKDNKLAIVKGDGGKYLIELYENNILVETKLFSEHTLRIVENYGKDWINQ
jgi:hypothetical protein